MTHGRLRSLLLKISWFLHVFSISLDLQLPTLSRSFSVFLSLGLTISFSLCSAEKEDRSRGIIRKEEKKRRREEREKREEGRRRDPKMEDASGTCEEEESEEKMRRGVTGERERENNKKY
jgi:hypothetical protein